MLWYLMFSVVRLHGGGVEAGIGAVPVQPAKVVLVAGGDVMFGRFVRGRLHALRIPDPFRDVRPYLKAADLALANLETPITAKTYHVRRNTRFIFRAEPRWAGVLRSAGFHLMVTANNHALDQYGPGILETMAHLRRAGLAFVGTGRTLREAWAGRVVEVRGMRLGFLAATLLRNSRRRPRAGAVAHVREREARRRLVPLVRALAARADVVVVSLHWGYEYVHRPTWSQRRLAGSLVRAGASVVLGHHPHVLQGIERIGCGVVFYSLGNLLFDSHFGDTVESGLAQVTFVRGEGGVQVAEAAFLPLWRDRHGVPRVPSARVRAIVLERMARYSRSFRSTTRFRVVDERFVAYPRAGCGGERPVARPAGNRRAGKRHGGIRQGGNGRAAPGPVSPGPGSGRPGGSDPVGQTR